LHLVGLSLFTSYLHVLQSGSAELDILAGDSIGYCEIKIRMDIMSYSEKLPRERELFASINPFCEWS